MDLAMSGRTGGGWAGGRHPVVGSHTLCLLSSCFSWLWGRLAAMLRTKTGPAWLLQPSGSRAKEPSAAHPSN